MTRARHHDPRAQEIIDAHAARAGVDRKRFLETRSRSASRARFAAMAAVQAETDLSLQGIAKAFRLLDHTSVINGLRRHAERTGGQG